LDLETEARGRGQVDHPLLCMWQVMEGKLSPQWWLVLLEPKQKMQAHCRVKWHGALQKG